MHAISIVIEYLIHQPGRNHFDAICDDVEYPFGPFPVLGTTLILPGSKVRDHHARSYGTHDNGTVGQFSCQSSCKVTHSVFGHAIKDQPRVHSATAPVPYRRGRQTQSEPHQLIQSSANPRASCLQRDNAGTWCRIYGQISCRSVWFLLRVSPSATYVQPRCTWKRKGDSGSLSADIMEAGLSADRSGQPALCTYRSKRSRLVAASAWPVDNLSSGR